MHHRLERLILYAFPKRGFTWMIAAIANWPMSRLLIPWYIRHYRIDVADALLPNGNYPSLLAFFIRQLQPHSRPIGSGDVVSPVDGQVSELGTVDGGTVLQAKGRPYTVAALLGNAADAATFQGGHYITLYLSPRDYHRIHVPLSGTLTRWRHIPGRLYPVNPMGVRAVSRLFARNERVVTWLSTHQQAGQCAIVKIGAAGVGSVRTPYLPPFSVRQRAKGRISDGALHLPVEQGAEVGWFEFGSTVILLFSPGLLRDFRVRDGDRIRMGEVIADFL